MSHIPIPLAEVARLADPRDNVAIAIRDLEAQTLIQGPDGPAFRLSHPVLEGHRFLISETTSGQALLSWNLPFGMATRNLSPGTWLLNEMMRQELGVRGLPFAIPDQSNFADHRLAVSFDPAAHATAPQVEPATERLTFEGFARSSRRGTGTRNHLAVIAMSSTLGPLAEELAGAFEGIRDSHFDGVVAVAHTEGSGPGEPNNASLVVRTLAGFLVHPNLGGVVVLDDPGEPVHYARVEKHLRDAGLPWDEVPHRVVQVSTTTTDPKSDGLRAIRELLPIVGQARRTPQPASALKLALQCGGSDAFSGISGNPLAGWVAHALIAQGGSANLAETSELIGAESYVLERLADPAVGVRFLQVVDRFQQMAGWHGHGAEGNPSGGNLYRGLYNIVIKSIGAARKKDPRVRLDAVLDYAEPMTQPGFYFMDSAGNDLESVAGQVASGCNLIHFITGNGSITNFPFVPTLKIVTTTARHQLLSREMDVNAGEYLDGKPMEQLGRETLDLSLRTASGERTAGERAGHYQVQIWRNWHRSGPVRAGQGAEILQASGAPFPSLVPASRIPERIWPGWSNGPTPGLRRVGLIVPTSLCAGQVSLRAASRIRELIQTDSDTSNLWALDTCVALAHTEGCGVSRGEGEALFVRTLTSYMKHPDVSQVLLMEHGCEKTHLDFFRDHLTKQGMSLGSVGTCSIQRDGGLEACLNRAESWFRSHRHQVDPVKLQPSDLRLGVVAHGSHPDPDWEQQVVRAWQAGFQLVIAPGASPLGTSLLKRIGWWQHGPNLLHGDHPSIPGGYWMDEPSGSSIEAITGLGAAGCHLLVIPTHSKLPTHPWIPMLEEIPAEPDALMSPISSALFPHYPAFQVSRGYTGFSL